MDTTDGARADAAPDLPFLRFEAGGGGPVELDIPDQRASAEQMRRIEAAMEAVASASSARGGSRLRAALVDGDPPGRRVFSALEPVGVRTLGQELGEATGRELGEATGREFDADAIVFLVPALPGFGPGLDGGGTGAALQAAVHNVAILVAAGARPGSRDTLYLSAVVLALLSLGPRVPLHRDLLEGFMRSWARQKLGGSGDPPEWDEATVARMRAADPWAAAFMEGLSDAVGATGAIRLPAPTASLYAAARELQGRATLGAAEPAGRA